MATYTISNAVDHVWRLLRDLGDDEAHQLVTNDEIRAFLNQALATHAVRFPSRIAADVLADGSAYTDLPASWEGGLSYLVSVEYPIDEDPTSIVDPRYVGLYDSPTEQRLVWRTNRPATGTNVRLAFTASPVLAELAVDTTLVDAHFYPVCDLAASIVADSLAAKFAQASEPMLGADVASYRTKSQEWQSIARRLEDRYRSVMGISSGQAVGGTSGTLPAGRILNWDSRPSERGDYLIHRRIYR